MAGEIVLGQKSSWRLLKKLGEGDAGEVYQVESLLEKKRAILKRPRHSAFSSDVIRQAGQIEAEGKILQALHSSSLLRQGFGQTLTPQITLPELLDCGSQGTEFSDRYFIVISQAPGFSLNTLARLARFGLEPEALDDDLPGPQRAFLEALAQRGQVPDLIILRALSGLLPFLEKIHTARVYSDENEHSGILWNDVKPDHLFWDPAQALFTVIDWGNGRLLEEDGATRDRRNTRSDDAVQFVQEFGRFLAEVNPGLAARLDWPEFTFVGGASPALAEALAGLQERALDLLQEEYARLSDARQDEAVLIGAIAPTLDQLRELAQAQERVAALGDLPNFAGTEEFCVKLSIQLVMQERLGDFLQLAPRVCTIPGVCSDKWLLLGRLADLAAQNAGLPARAQECIRSALLSGLSDDWPGALWNLLLLHHGQAEPPWWDDLSRQIRQMQPEIGPDMLAPYVVASRYLHTLQAIVLKLEVPNGRPGEAGAAPGGAAAPAAENVAEETAAVVSAAEVDPRSAYARVIATLRDEVLARWKEVEPDPPDSGLEYNDLERLLPELSELLADARPAIQNALAQPKAQVEIVLAAWDSKDFETARRGLRRVLFWDPDRRRVLLAEQAILAAPGWLEKVYQGPTRDELLKDYMTRMELEGRELRNQVGPARWLDLILETFTRLRRGASPVDIILERPEILSEVYWLNEYEARRPADPEYGRPVVLERGTSRSAAVGFLSGGREAALGAQGGFALVEPLDTWAPEARGSSARVYLGELRSETGRKTACAIKIMRPNRVDYALPLFREEVQILTLMRDLPGVVGLLECGFIQLESEAGLPPDDQPAAIQDLQGNVLRYGMNEIRDFLAGLDTRIAEGWLPYLALEKFEREHNLMTLCDAGYNHGRYLPVVEGLRLGIQLCDILHASHARNIVYRDHKILHYYWIEENNGVFVIDWNVARRHPQGLSKSERQFDLVQFGARALHHILAGRTAPGALPLGPTRPEEIDQAAQTYTAQWTYDDQRLPGIVKEVVEKVLAGGYDEARTLREDLVQCFLRFPEASLFPEVAEP